MYRVEINATVWIVKSVSVCTFVTVRLVERLKMAPGESGTRGVEVVVVKTSSGAK